MERKIWTLSEHIQDVKDKKRRFETVFEALLRMIWEKPPEKIMHCGSQKIEYPVFRQGKRHIVDLFDELNTLAHYISEAAGGGDARKMALVFVSEPATGKTFLIEYLFKLYRNFLRREENRKYTFRFANLEALGSYGKLSYLESQAYEDPTILAMNLFEDENENKKYLCENFGFSDNQIETLYKHNHGLGPDSDYVLNEIRDYADGDIKKMLEFFDVVPVRISDHSGIMTARHTAKDKITSSADELLGVRDGDPIRTLSLKNSDNPYRYDLRRGALSRVASGGIHCADEIYKNKKDYIQIYLGVIEDRRIERDGLSWPMNTFIIGISNNEEYEKFKSEEGEAPIISRCVIRHVSHVTNYKSQELITAYALGDEQRKTIYGEDLHIDPNLKTTLSIILALTRLPKSEKLTMVEELKLAAGEVAGEKSADALKEIVDESNEKRDVTQRFGQKGLSYRDLDRILQLLTERYETNEGKCMFAHDLFKCAERVVLDYVNDANDQIKYKNDIKEAKKLYKKHIETQLYNAYRNDSRAIEKDVSIYVNMVLAIGTDDLDNIDNERMCKYKDPQTGKMVPMKIDKKYINSVESRLGLGNQEQRKTYRSTIRTIYGQKIQDDPNYNFMDNLGLVNAVTEVITKSDILGAGSLIGALSNRSANEKNKALYDRMMNTMLDKNSDKPMSYCRTCAEKTIEVGCNKEDES